MLILRKYRLRINKAFLEAMKVLTWPLAQAAKIYSYERKQEKLEKQATKLSYDKAVKYFAKDIARRIAKGNPRFSYYYIVADHIKDAGYSNEIMVDHYDFQQRWIKSKKGKIALRKLELDIDTKLDIVEELRVLGFTVREHEEKPNPLRGLENYITTYKIDIPK